MSNVKKIARTFAAFDRDTYERIIPSHSADLKTVSNQYPQLCGLISYNDKYFIQFHVSRILERL